VGDDEIPLRRSIQDCPHQARIHRLSYVEDRLALINQASLLVYPSLYEGFGFPPLEAMALGVPVVASSAGALPEILGEAAILVPPTNVASLADAISQVLSSETVRERLIREGILCASRYDWVTAAAAIADLYRLLV
jgi:glycosyltransferase involved in cell wall biosynthesis